jgi:hypothetical protein
MENSWFLSKPLVFHRTMVDINDLTSDSDSPSSITSLRIVRYLWISRFHWINPAVFWLAWTDRQTDRKYSFFPPFKTTITLSFSKGNNQTRGLSNYLFKRVWFFFIL